MSGPLRLPPLYPIVNVTGARQEAVEAARALALELAEADAGILQLRAKDLGAGRFTELATELARPLRERGCLLLINDRADVALASAAGGVHVGDEDLPVHAVRTLLGADAVIGFSTHSVQEMVAAAGGDADYLAFGPVFDSPTKAGVREARSVELLAQACKAAGDKPVVAIGGVTLQTAPLCWRAGATSVAVISEIERCGDRRALVAQYTAAAESLRRR